VVGKVNILVPVVFFLAFLVLFWFYAAARATDGHKRSIAGVLMKDTSILDFAGEPWAS
jgi:hypothetical protein